MPDRRTIRIFLNGMCAMCLLLLLTIAGTIWYIMAQLAAWERDQGA